MPDDLPEQDSGIGCLPDAMARLPETLITLPITACICMAAMLFVSTPPARAQTVGDVQDYLKRNNPRCDIDLYREVYRGPLQGAAQAVMVATFSIDGCDGANSGADVFGVFSEYGGAVREWPLVPEIAGRVTSVAVVSGRVEVRWSSWKPSDPRCCPSVAHKTTFVLRDGQAVATR